MEHRPTASEVHLITYASNAFRHSPHVADTITMQPTSRLNNTLIAPVKFKNILSLIGGCCRSSWLYWHQSNYMCFYCNDKKKLPYKIAPSPQISTLYLRTRIIFRDPYLNRKKNGTLIESICCLSVCPFSQERLKISTLHQISRSVSVGAIKALMISKYVFFIYLIF